MSTLEHYIINKIVSENYIKKYQFRVDWYDVCFYQRLSEDFMREFQDQINWFNISMYQKLSENFIREFQDQINWILVCKYQILSDKFIRDFIYKINWTNICKYQHLNSKFIDEFKLSINKNVNWLYVTKEWKLAWIKNNTAYEVIDDQYIIAYKAVRSNGISVFNNHFDYKVGYTYEDFHCDCNIDELNSFGLSAWDKKNAKDYYESGKILKVKINIEDIGCIVPHHNNKIRCWKLTVLE